MKYIEALELIEKCVQSDILLEKDGYIFISREHGESLERKEYVAQYLMNDLDGQKILKEALKIKEG